MARMFQVDPWHAHAPYSCRPYKKVVVDLVNTLKPERVVEVGCGLGDILSRIEARDRFGLDADADVIRAARFLHPGKVRWLHGKIEDVVQVLPPAADMDCLILVNWIHNLSSAELAALLLPVLPRTKHLVLDAIDANAPASYRYKHDFAFLSKSAERVSVARSPDEPRSFILYKVAR
ncbi:MAG: class I SAM-dependent methyltransferase [Gammaproteobacteria bacterium]